MTNILLRDQYKALKPKSWDASRESVLKNGVRDCLPPNKHKKGNSKVTSTEFRDEFKAYFPTSMDRAKKIKVNVVVAGTYAHVLQFIQGTNSIFTLRENGTNIDFNTKEAALTAFQALEELFNNRSMS